MRRKLNVKKGRAFKDWRVMDDVGNIVASCIWQNAARKICRLLNASAAA